MNIKDRVDTNLNVIATYIDERGQEEGTVSWQMVIQSIKMLKEDFEELYDGWTVLMGKEDDNSDC